jgi:hypothetical protein
VNTVHAASQRRGALGPDSRDPSHGWNGPGAWENIVHRRRRSGKWPGAGSLTRTTPDCTRGNRPNLPRGSMAATGRVRLRCTAGVYVRGNAPERQEIGSGMRQFVVAPTGRHETVWAGTHSAPYLEHSRARGRRGEDAGKPVGRACVELRRPARRASSPTPSDAETTTRARHIGSRGPGGPEIGRPSGARAHRARQRARRRAPSDRIPL